MTFGKAVNGVTPQLALGVFIALFTFLLDTDRALAQNRGEMIGSLSGATPYWFLQTQTGQNNLSDSVNTSLNGMTARASYSMGMNPVPDRGVAMTMHINDQVISTPATPSSTGGALILTNWKTQVQITPTNPSLAGAAIQVAPIYSVQGTDTLTGFTMTQADANSLVQGSTTSTTFAAGSAATGLGQIKYTAGGPTFSQILPASPAGTTTTTFGGTAFLALNASVNCNNFVLSGENGTAGIDATFNLIGIQVTLLDTPSVGLSNSAATILDPSEYQVTIADPQSPYFGQTLDTTPEPCGVALLGTGGLFLMAPRRRLASRFSMGKT